MLIVGKEQVSVVDHFHKDMLNTNAHFYKGDVDLEKADRLAKRGKT